MGQFRIQVGPYQPVNIFQTYLIQGSQKYAFGFFWAEQIGAKNVIYITYVKNLASEGS